ncbi:hypothetical protein [Thermonema rossianum]|uniref:hypothetical protein n=1 Tax=Thermonema rossianum TaxID=55505 RepID=UPI00069243E0|nr:hypothetical protein [Thermonema rossianum]
MRYFILLLVIALLPVSNTQACEICGCGAGSYYFGIMPQFHRHFVGLRYRQAGFRSHVNSDYLRTQEQFHIAEIWGRFYVHPRVQVMVFVPYGLHTREVESSRSQSSLQGMGDAMVMGMYRVWDTAQDTTRVRSWKHAFWLGGGVKTPTGVYDSQGDLYNDPAANPNFQIGTGSWDFLLSALYTFRFTRWGISSQWSYKHNTANRDHYRFGHRLTQNTEFFYIHQLRRFGIMPHAGIYSEWIQKDENSRKVMESTGGYSHNAVAGLDLFFKQKVQVGFLVQSPIDQKLSAGEVLAQNRYQLQVGILFSSFKKQKQE